MSFVIYAEDAPVKARRDYWRHVVGDTFVPMDLRIAGDGNFQGWIRGADLGDVRATEVFAPAGEVLRTPSLIRKSDPEVCKLEVCAGASLVFEQDGREAGLAAGRLHAPGYVQTVASR